MSRRSKCGTVRRSRASRGTPITAVWSGIAPAASPTHHQHPLHQDWQRVPDEARQWVPGAQTWSRVPVAFWLQRVNRRSVRPSGIPAAAVITRCIPGATGPRPRCGGQYRLSLSRRRAGPRRSGEVRSGPRHTQMLSRSEGRFTVTVGCVSSATAEHKTALMPAPAAQLLPHVRPRSPTQ